MPPDTKLRIFGRLKDPARGWVKSLAVHESVKPYKRWVEDKSDGVCVAFCMQWLQARTIPATELQFKALAALQETYGVAYRSNGYQGPALRKLGDSCQLVLGFSLPPSAGPGGGLGAAVSGRISGRPDPGGWQHFVVCLRIRIVTVNGMPASEAAQLEDPAG